MLCRDLGISDYDCIIAGDGSGTGWNDAAGWSAILIDRHERDRKLFLGGLTNGSINLAEMLPYLHALSWYHAARGHKRLSHRGHLVVHIVTDSQVTVDHGTTAVDVTRPLPKVSTGFWACIRVLAQQGYRIHFHHAERLTTELNQATDLVSSLSRRAIKRVAEREVSLAQKTRMRRVAQLAKQALALGGPVDYRAHTAALLYALQTLLEADDKLANQAAQELERVGLQDPITGEPIDLMLLTPDATHQTTQ